VTSPECPTATELADFHAGRLADDRIAAVGEHLDACAGCRAAPAAAPLPPTTAHPPARFDGEAGCRRARELVARVTASEPGAGHVLGDFRLLRELGRGGMGVVYEAEQQSLGRRVAVKVVQPRGPADPDLMRRFEREAKAVGRLHHTNIVPVFGVGEYDGSPFYAMQLIRGVGLNEVIDALGRHCRGEPVRDDLADRLARPLTPRDSAGLIAQAADGRYSLFVLANQVTAGGQQLDGDGNGTGGDDFVLDGTVANGLYRLYGDVTGDGTINAADFGQFRPAFGSSTGQTAYRDFLDFNNDGSINAFDFAQFRTRFGSSVP
jgi:hypothetical protein